MAPEPPRTIGRYEVVDRIGRGGMGVVFKAKDPRIGRQVAIKLLSVPDESLRDRFVQEAQSVGNLAHRNIVTIFDFGEHEGQSYIVMEYVEGVTLAEQIHDSVPIALWRKLEIVEELAAGLDYAHNKGIVHRDVKPANVMTDRDGVVKILDFGIARVGNVTMTQAGMMLGTPNYMSPEQFESGRVDRRSDIFSVGVLFYELLAYRKAFTGEQVWDVMKAVMTKSPPPLSEFVPGIDSAVEAAVMRAIEKDPAKRYQTLAELNTDISKVRARLAVKLATRDSDTVLTPPVDEAPRTPRPSADRELIAKRRAERIEGYLAEAQRAFDAGEFGTAVESCDQALMLDPDDARAHSLLEQARRALDRQQAVEVLAEARGSLERGDLEQAAKLVDQASQLDASFDEARDLKAQVTERIRQRDAEHKKRQQELAAAKKAVDKQKREFAAGRYHEALGALERYTPRLEVIAAAIADMRTELAEIDKRNREEEEQQKREQEEAQRRWVARQFDLARRAMAVQKFVEAIEILEHVRRNSSSAPGLSDLLKQAHLGKSAAEEIARRNQEIAGILERAGGEVARGKLLDARSLVASALTMDPAHPDALAKLREIKNAIDVEEQQKQEAARLREAERLRREKEEAAAAEARAKKEQEAAAAEARAQRQRDAAAAEARAKQEREAAAAAAAARTKEEQEAAAAAAELRAKQEREAAAVAAETRVREEREAAAAAVEAKAKQEREAAAAAEARATKEREAAAAEARATQERAAAAAAAEARATKEREAAAAEARAKQEREAAAEARKKAERAKAAEAAATTEAPDVSAGLAGALGASIESARAAAKRAQEFLPPLSELTQPTPRNLGIGGAALFVLLLVVYFAFLRGPSTPEAEIARAPEPAPAPTTTVAPAPTTTVAPAPPPPVETTPPVVTPQVATPPAPAAPDPAVEQQLAQVRDQARQQFSRGEWQSGLTTAAAGFELRKGDPGIQTILNSALTTARSRMTTDRDIAVAIGRHAVGTSSFKSGVRKQESVEQLRRSGQTADAIRGAWEASELFKIAQSEGRRLAQAEAALGRPVAQPAPTPSTPAPPTQPTPPGSVAPQPTPPPPPPAPEPPPARPAPQPAPAPPSAPPVSNTAADQRDIRNLLQVFADAYSQLDVRAVQRLYPKVDVDRLTKSFAELRSQQVAPTNVQFVNLTDSTATVTCTWQVAFVGNAGSPRRESPKVTFRLQKTNGVWTIVDRR